MNEGSLLPREAHSDGRSIPFLILSQGVDHAPFAFVDRGSSRGFHAD